LKIFRQGRLIDFDKQFEDQSMIARVAGDDPGGGIQFPQTGPAAGKSLRPPRTG
jgi:hypothetical protein